MVRPRLSTRRHYVVVENIAAPQLPRYHRPLPLPRPGLIPISRSFFALPLPRVALPSLARTLLTRGRNRMLGALTFYPPGLLGFLHGTPRSYTVAKRSFEFQTEDANEE